MLDQMISRGSAVCVLSGPAGFSSGTDGATLTVGTSWCEMPSVFKLGCSYEKFEGTVIDSKVGSLLD